MLVVGIAMLSAFLGLPRPPPLLKRVLGTGLTPKSNSDLKEKREQFV